MAAEAKTGHLWGSAECHAGPMNLKKGGGLL